MKSHSTSSLQVTKTKILGERFGRLVVVKAINGSEYLCQCDCGNTCPATKGSLLSGSTQSCKCLRKELTIKMGKSRLIDLTGQRFGMLDIVRRAEKEEAVWSTGEALFLCQCDCGSEPKIIPSSYLRHLGVESCGCKGGLLPRGDLVSEKNRKKTNTKKTKEKMLSAISRSIEAFPNRVRLFLEVETKHEGQDLKICRENVRSAYHRLRSRKKYPAKDSINLFSFIQESGYCTSVIKILALPSGSYMGHNYWKRDKFRQLWRESLRTDDSFSFKSKNIKEWADADELFSFLVLDIPEDRHYKKKYSMSGFFSSAADAEL